MRRINVAFAAAVLAVSAGALPAYGTPGGDRWVPAQQSEQVAIVNALNADLTAHDAQLHPGNCFSIVQLRGHQSLAAVSIRPRVNPAACGNAKDFGIYVLRRINGHWTGLATATGIPGSACTYSAKAPAKVTALLAKVGPCYKA
jgi:hypothetical protein